MCNDVYTWYLTCGCSIYQNTFQCHVARRCKATDDLSLRETAVLPAPPPKMPPGLLPCKRNVATRPVWGECSACRRRAREKERGGEGKEKEKEKGERVVKVEVKESKPALTLNHTEDSMDLGVESFGDTSRQDDDTPSPDGKALARVRDSFMQLTEEHRPSPLRRQEDDDSVGGTAP